MSRTDMIPHSSYVRARKALTRYLNTRGHFIGVIGLPDVGKPETLYYSMQAVARAPELRIFEKPSVIALRMAATDRSYFIPKELIARLYLELREKAVDPCEAATGDL